MPTQDHLWNEEEAARYLNVSPFTIRSWRQKGKIGYTKLGGVFRYIPEEIKAFAVRGRVAARCPGCGSDSHGAILLPSEVNPFHERYFSDMEQVS